MCALQLILLLLAGPAAPTDVYVGTLLPSAADTTEMVRIADCGPYGIAVQGVGGDSVSVYLDQSLDGTNWRAPNNQLNADVSAVLHLTGSHTGRNRPNAWWIRLRLVNESPVDTVTSLLWSVACLPK